MLAVPIFQKGTFLVPRFYKTIRGLACEQAPGGASAEQTFGAKRRVIGACMHSPKSPMSASKFWMQSGDWWIIIIHDVILVFTSGIDKNQNGRKERRVLQEACKHLFSYSKFKLQLKPEQRNAVEYLLNHHDVLATGYGKSLIFQLVAVAASIERKEPQTVLVVCPLKSVIEDQIAEAESTGIPVASAVDISEDELRAAKFHVIFGSAEAVLERRFLNIFKDSGSSLQKKLAAVVVDESHTVELWTGKRYFISNQY